MTRDGALGHVLVIEDDPGLAALYREVLADEGYRVSVKVAPELDPDSILASAPDLLMIDLLFAHEPRGLALVEPLKAHPATRPLPILECSADARLLDEIQDRLQAWDCGVLTKPFDLDTLLATVDMCLGAGVGATRRSGPSRSSVSSEVAP